MRIVEFASAQEQMALLKLIFDKTWETLGTQAKQQAQAKANQQRAAKPAAKRKGLRRAAIPVPKPPTPKTPTPSKTIHTLKPVLANPQQKYPTPQPTQTLRQPNPQLKPIAPQPALSIASNPSTDAKPAEYGEKHAAIKKYGEGDDRHSKNTFKPR
jgi:hypothetical protein